MSLEDWETIGMEEIRDKEQPLNDRQLGKNITLYIYDGKYLLAYDKDGKQWTNLTTGYVIQTEIDGDSLFELGQLDTVLESVRQTVIKKLNALDTKKDEEPSYTYRARWDGDSFFVSEPKPGDTFVIYDDKEA